MSRDVKSDAPKPVAVTEDSTDTIVHPGDASNKAVRVNVVAGALASTTTAKATAAPPTYVEGTDSPISQDLAGNLRTLASVSATTTAKATAADPAYAEGADSPISQDRTGHLRTTGLTDTQLRATAVSVSAAALPLPAGASTEATLALIKAKTDNLDVLLSTRTKPADTQAVSVGTLPLPAGAATAAKQDTGNTSLASIDTKLTNPLPVSGAVTDAKATAAAPSYIEASNNPLSVDLAGNLRTVSVGGTTYFPITESSVYVDATTTLTLTHTPTDTPRVFVDRIRQVEGTDYSRSGAVITWITIPPTGAYIQVDYTWSMASSTLNTTLVVDASGNVQPTGDTVARSIYVLPSAGDLTSGSQLAQITDSDGDRANVTKLGSLQVEWPSRDRAALESQQLTSMDAAFAALCTRNADKRSGFIDRRGRAGQRGIR